MVGDDEEPREADQGVETFTPFSEQDRVYRQRLRESRPMPGSCLCHSSASADAADDDTVSAAVDDGTGYLRLLAEPQTLSEFCHFGTRATVS